MALKDIMAISGQSGLFKFISQGRNGIIVESLGDGKRSHVSASAKVSALSDISIFTNDGEKPLREILELIKQKENGGPSISSKSGNDELKSFFIGILPNYDSERVYVSDIKKVVNWYNQLQASKMLDFTEEVEEVAEQSTAHDPVHEENKADLASGTKKATSKKKPLAVEKKISAARVKSAEPKNVAPKRKTSTNKKSG